MRVHHLHENDDENNRPDCRSTDDRIGQNVNRSETRTRSVFIFGHYKRTTAIRHLVHYDLPICSNVNIIRAYLLTYLYRPCLEKRVNLFLGSMSLK